MKEKHPKGTPGHRAQDYSRAPKGCPCLSYCCRILEGQTQAAPSLLFWDFSGGTLKFSHVCSLPYEICQERDSPLNPAPTELLATTAGPSSQPGGGYPKGSGAVP